MNREERRKKSKASLQKEIERHNKRAIRNRRQLVSIHRFLTHSMSDPESYIKTSNRIYLLRCLGNVIDSVLTDIDSVMRLSDFDESSAKLMRSISADCDTLLKRLREYSIRAFGDDRAKDGQPDDSEYDDLCKVSLSLQDLMELYLIYFIDPDDSWRLTELDKFISRVVPSEATKAKVAKAEVELHRLYDDKVKMIENILAKPVDNQ